MNRPLLEAQSHAAEARRLALLACDNETSARAALECACRADSAARHARRIASECRLTQSLADFAIIAESAERATRWAAQAGGAYNAKADRERAAKAGLLGTAPAANDKTGPYTDAELLGFALVMLETARTDQNSGKPAEPWLTDNATLDIIRARVADRGTGTATAWAG